MSSDILKNIIIKKLESDSGCSICSTILDFEFQLLSKIQYEIAFDENIREEIARDGGFCDFHFRQFKRLANGKTKIVLLKKIIESGAYKNYNFNIRCRICKEVNDYELTLLQIFIKLLTDNGNKERFEKSNGICFVHLELVKNLTGNQAMKNWLHEIYANQIVRLRKEFDEMDNVSSYYEIDRGKRKLINSLIQKLTGRKSGGL